VFLNCTGISFGKSSHGASFPFFRTFPWKKQPIFSIISFPHGKIHAFDENRMGRLDKTILRLYTIYTTARQSPNLPTAFPERNKNNEIPHKRIIGRKRSRRRRRGPARAFLFVAIFIDRRCMRV
jgi:hypothetical protein